MTTTETWLLADLRALRALLATPERWTQMADARDANGEETGIYGHAATSWCLFGGGCRVTSTQDPWRSRARLEKLWGALGLAEMLFDWEPGWPKDLSCWNDAPERTHAEVLALIDDAISRVEASS
jgi:hypothetical protein